MEGKKMDAKSTMLKSRSMKEQRMKEQFDKALNRKYTDDWHKNSYPNYSDNYAKKVKAKEPNFVEYGKAIPFARALVMQEQGVKMAYDMCLSDFFKARAESFPQWDGLPEIKINPSVDPLQRDIQIAWYAQVPKEYVISPDDKLEEDLWNS